MKRLIAVLTMLAFFGSWAWVPTASARDPKHIGGQSEDDNDGPGVPAALEGATRLAVASSSG